MAKKTWHPMTWNGQRMMWECSERPAQSSETFPTSGTMRSGRLLPHLPSGPPINANACSFSQPAATRFPTPQTGDSGEPQTREARAARGYGPDLKDVVVHEVPMLPTPRTQNGETRNQNIWHRPDGQPQNLENALARVPSVQAAAGARAVGVTLLPTPTTQPATGNGHARNLGKEVQLLPTPRSSRGASTTEISYALGGERRDDDRPQGEVLLLPTPTVQDSKNNGGAAQHERNTPPLNVVATLMPTPQARDWKEGMSNQRDLNDAILREDVTLLPTPSASDRFGPGRSSAKQGGDNLRTVCCNETVSEENHVPEVNWGKYAEAVKRWEGVTRPAPSPTEPNAKGNPRLAPMFAEWMMGWPEGWVTDPAIGLTRNDQLKAIGNGVVPHQAIAALRSLLPHAGIKVGDG